MSQSHDVLTRSELADAAITQYRIVKITSTGVAAATADTDAMIGVAQETVAAGETVPVRMIGTSKVTASDAISKGARLTATTGGKAVTTVTNLKTIIGIALEDAAADGDIIEVLLTPMAMISL